MLIEHAIADDKILDVQFHKAAERLFRRAYDWLAAQVETCVDQDRTAGTGVRLQMVWDNLSCLGTEALARLGLRLGGFQLMFQSSLSDGVAFDPFSFQKDGSASAEVDVGRCQVL